MTTSQIVLAPGLKLPLDAVTQTFAVLGVRGSGKTVTSSVMTEQMIAAGLPVVVVDPIGVWWGLRHSRDGKKPGLSVVILGGEHADVPLEETGGAVIADFIVEHRVPAVLDLGSFSKSAHRRFMVDFAERLYRVNRAALHVVLDEADTLCPQRPDHGGERLVGAINDIVRRGRARGLGATLISQRPALISKDVLTQVEALVVHRMTGPQDRDAVERWVEHNADRKQAETVLASLQSLKNGEAWFWSPGWLGLFKRAQINMRATFDSSATPKAGARVAAPKNPAEVDLVALRDRLSATIEKAKADDPRELRKRIAELEKADRLRPIAPAPKPEIKEVPVFTARELAAIEKGVKESAELQAVLGRLTEQWSAALKRHGPSGNLWGSTNGVSRDVKPVHVSAPPPEAWVKKAAKPPVVDGDWRPGKCELKILQVLGQRHPKPTTIGQLAVMSRYRISGGFKNSISKLRAHGMLVGDNGAQLYITSDGQALAPTESLPEGRALLDVWLPTIGVCERKIIEHLMAIYPDPTDTETLAAATGYRVSGGFKNSISKLRTLELAQGYKDQIRATDTLGGDG